MVILVARDDSGSSTLNMSCQELGEIIHHDDSPMGWREFQEEIKKRQVLTGAGVQQVIVGALQSRVAELDRREFLDGSLSSRSASPHISAINSPNASWSDPLRNLSLGSSSAPSSKRGTMSMLMMGLGKEVDEKASQQPTPMNRRATASTASSSQGFLSSQSGGSRQGTLTPASSFRRANADNVGGGARRSTLAHSMQLSRTNSQAGHARRGSILADVMANLNGEQKHSMTQSPIAPGMHVRHQRGGCFGKDCDSDKIQGFKRSSSGTYSATGFNMDKEGVRLETSAMASAFNRTKAAVQSARSA